jgi:RNA polymerase sigma-70 factor (ECF subfamily)
MTDHERDHERDTEGEQGMGERPGEAEEALARRFEEHRGHLRAVAYRMLGSLSEAEDAVQETWLRLSRSDIDGVHNLGGWLTTVTGRICLDLLRSRRTRREEPMEAYETFVPDPVVGSLDRVDPEQQVLHADSVGLALLVVLETLEPAERLAFVLHDMFAVPFDDIAQAVGRSSAATRQLASRARRRVQGSAPAPQPDLARQREVVEAFLAASRGGDFEALVSVLDPEVVLRADAGALAVGAAASKVLRGRERVAESAFMFRQFSPYARPVLVNGSVGLVTVLDGKAVSVMGLTVGGGRITGMYILSDPDRVARLDLASVVEEQGPE